MFETISLVWGRASTVTLAVLVAVLPTLQVIDPELLPGWAKLTIGLLGAVVAVLRIAVPPPPSVRVLQADTVNVDRDTETVTIVKNSEPVSHEVFTKTAGEKI